MRPRTRQVVELNLKKIRSTRDKIQMVRDWKAICAASGRDVFMYGWLYTQIEQFLELDFAFWQVQRERARLVGRVRSRPPSLVLAAWDAL